MRLKTKLVLAISALVFLIAGLVSLVYVHQLVKTAVQQTYDANWPVAQQVRLALQNALESGLRDRTVDPSNPGELRELVAETVRNDAQLRATLESVNRYYFTVYDVNIGDSQGMTLLSTNPDNEGKPLPSRLNYEQLRKASPLRMMTDAFRNPTVFDVVAPIENNGKLFATVNVGVHTSLLRAVYQPLLKNALRLMALVLIVALTAALLLSNLALRPLTEISRQLDRLTAAGELPVEGKAASEKDVAALVSTKIEKIGQRMRNVEEVYSALRENLDQILGNLQDGILLFTEDKRAVLVSEAARRFLGLDRDNILGRPAREIFLGSTVLGRTLREAIDAGATIVKEEIHAENGRRIQASVDFIYDDDSHRGLGALVTLHDLDSAEEIESELELSRRMAAIGRLTSGVGHEVKNPINAIVVHLELLKSKLGEAEGPATRHLEVIDAEIRRLDRVVQTLVDFSRPVELQLREQDLRLVIGDVLALAADELTTRKIKLTSRMPEEPLIANVDADLLKQAVLNVIQNGAQAMPEGGRLEVALEEDRSADGGRPPQARRNGVDGVRAAYTAPRFAVLRIADEGEGIPAEIREKIFDLYFTTKSGGSGIGLAMTYRILQFHHGSVDVQSREGRGTEFLLRIPLSAADRAHRAQQPGSIPSDTELGK
ncbi:MAG: ATP-binding protein [Terracidiphilus sp.]|nr:ATP-binding protein [Terracidiphilus sp.]MDR3798723.1 ATP-binding protein [Terracidiphilus sp.]